MKTTTHPLFPLIACALIAPTAVQDADANNWAPVALGLNNPRQMSIGPDGTLYVAEAGSGKVGATDLSGGCWEGPEGGGTCAGDTGAITAIPSPATATPADAQRVVTGLLSLAGEGSGTAAVGPNAVSVAPDGTVFAIVTYGPKDLLPTSVAGQAGKLVRVAPNSEIGSVANIGAFSIHNPLDGHPVDSNPYGLLALGRRNFVTDAGNNTLLQVDKGRITEIATFRHRPADPFDGVPTSIALGPDGLLYVGELGSMVPGQGRVSVWTQSGEPVRVIPGLTQVTSIAVDGAGNIYVTQLFANAVVKLANDGTPLATAELPLPGGIAVDAAGNVYVSVFSIFPGQGPFPGNGAVWRGTL